MEERSMSTSNGNKSFSLARLILFVKRKLKLNRFLLVIDIKKGVSISAITVIIVDIIDLLFNLSMTFGPINSTLTSLLLLETLLVVFISVVLLYVMRNSNKKQDIGSILLLWLFVVAIVHVVHFGIIVASLLVSQKASRAAKATRAIWSVIMLALVAHCWQCVFTFFDENNAKIKHLNWNSPNWSSNSKDNSVRR